MKNEIFTTHDYAAIKQMLAEMNPVDIAEEFEELEDDRASAVKLFRMLAKDTASDVFAYLSSDMQQNIVTAIKDYEVKNIIDDLFLDDAVDFIEEMPAGIVKRVLRNLPADKREMINQFLKYPENSAGSIMTIEYIDLKEHLTVGDTFKKIRAEGVDKETIYTCYVIDAARHLLGLVTVRTLLLSSPEEEIGDIMERDVHLRRHDRRQGGNRERIPQIRSARDARSGQRKPTCRNRHVRRRDDDSGGRGHGGLRADGGVVAVGGAVPKNKRLGADEAPSAVAIDFDAVGDGYGRDYFGI